jgi:segregation and condensation protein B
LGEGNLLRELEAVLFVADGPVGLDELAQAIDASTEAIEAAIEALLTAAPGRGLTIARLGRRVQMVTVPEAGPAVERYLGADHAPKLSAAALETLAIIAYRQPITRAQVDAVRGVNSDGVLRTLVARSLVCPVGRLEQAGRPVLYSTTFDFLEYLGIGSLDELPALPEGEIETLSREQIVAPPPDAA